ncbi:TonB-linked SusC/RagA family outer membrane protein [Arcticibacter pallidicorallinus]|uniref:TonB-linked SusC/RagA family outer membrane protein n=1 Tax=Arcticibacter pallidicorallinus TaxID=1259464 RepID=A0A2T0UB97_9SPHI|nr:TonB-dependent receptor [Arcticibacter pallidicorallinus]PRY55164.1 TonB-linked SusC/RagA family outer membrane protein [Arcticibacter pallidicorallinus]
MKKRITSFLLALLLYAMHLSAQDLQISGKVTLKSDNSPLPGVTVTVQGTSLGTATNPEGGFSIRVPKAGSVLVFSQIGLEGQRYTVTDSRAVNISMTETATNLSEVVVIGYGTQLRREISSAISSVKPDDITQTPVQRVEQALQGRVAGVQVTNISGQPGDAPTVRIRGIGTNGDASPIYIVDGFQVGGIDYLNPADIQSMDVLKDAASAAIYGARGGNGVVLITTKSGVKDGRMHVSYDGYTGIQNAWRQMRLLDARQYVVMMNEGAANGGGSIPFPDVSKYPSGTGTDWQKALFQTNAPINNHQVSVTGGTAKNSFAGNFSIFDQEGLVGGDKSKFKRYTFRVNSDNQVKEFLKVGANMAYSHIRRSAIDPNQEFGGLINNAINLDPITPVIETDPAVTAKYNPNSVRDPNGNFYGISPYVTQEVVNPLARLAVLNGLTRVDKIVGNTYAELKIVEGLTFRSAFSIDLGYVNGNNYSPIFYLNAAQQNANSSVNKNVDRYYTWQAENVLSYNKDWENHSLGLTLGTTSRKENSETLFGSNTGLVVSDPNMAYLNLAVDAGSAKATGGASENALFSLFSRVNYSYDNKYLLSASLRRDGSSKFGKNNPYGYFPAVSAGWIFTEENFLAESSFLTFGKLRASWGQNGNDRIGDYPWAAVIGVGRGYTFYNGTGNGYINGASPSYIANPDIKWEASEQTDIGLDLSFMRNILSFSADYYIKTTKGWLLQVPIPLSVGVAAGTANGGSVRNSGIELALNYQQNFGEFKVNAGVNGSFNKNEVTEINNAERILPGAGISTYGQVERSTVGQPFSYFYGYETNGIFQNISEIDAHSVNGTRIQPLAQPGDVRFKDRNGNGEIDQDDRTMIGNPTPKITAGFTFGVDFKGFDLNGFFTGAFGNQIFNGTRRHDFSSSNMQTLFLNRWTGEGSTNDMPRFTSSDNNGNYTKISDLYLEDGDYVRLKTLQLGYTLGTELSQKIRLQKIRFYASADNLITLTNYTGFDPEIGARGSLDIGIDRGIYPQARTFRFGLSATF